MKQTNPVYRARQLNGDGSFEDRDFMFEDEGALQKMAEFKEKTFIGFMNDCVILAFPKLGITRIKRDAILIEMMP